MSNVDTWIEVDKNGIGWEIEQYRSAPGTVYGHQQTNRRQLPPNITNFCCRVCGNKKFEAIYFVPDLPKFDCHTVIGPGSSRGLPQTDNRPIIDYRCPGCTVHFDNPAKFSRNQPAEIVPPEATPSPADKLNQKFREIYLEQKRDKSDGSGCHASHRPVGMSWAWDVKEHDNVCALCDVGDVKNGGWGQLVEPCSGSDDERQAFDSNPKAAEEYLERALARGH